MLRQESRAFGQTSTDATERALYYSRRTRGMIEVIESGEEGTIHAYVW